MKDFGIVKSAVKPETKIIDDYSVWINSDIEAITEPATDEHETGFTGYKYHMIQYTKDEYISLIDEKNTILENQITDTQLALCEVYELMG